MPRVLLVACEGADWAIIHELGAAGALPNLQRLVEHGASGTLRAVPPLRGEILWTSLATGCGAPRHGVTSQAEKRPDGSGVQPAGRRSWRVPAFWESLAHDGIATVVVNWPATWPATRWPGITIDERFAKAGGRDFDDWPLAPDSVSPTELRAAMRELRVHPADISGDEIAVFVPDMQVIDPASDDRLARIVAMIAEATTVHAAATQLAAESSWELLVVRYELLAQAQGGFLKYRNAAGGERRFANVVDAAYRFLDMMLGRLIELCGERTDLLLLSPRGTAGPGALVAHGPSIASDRIVHGATIFDVAPTVLALFGRAADGAQDGRILEDVVRAPSAELRPVPPVPAVRESSDTDTTSHLRALNYSDAPTPAQAQALRDAELASLLHLAESEIALGGYRDAASFAERALALAPDSLPATLLLAQARAHLGEWEACAPLADTLLSRQADAPWGSLLKGAVFAIGGDRAAAEPHLARARELGRATPLAQLHLGLLALRLRDTRTAEAHFGAAIALQPDLVPALHGLAAASRAGGDLDATESFLRQAIALRYHFPDAHFQLGLILAERDRMSEAAHALRTALQQDPALPGAEQALQRVVQALVTRARDGA
jgi:tetratricopeptide (TPR) repeat protein